MGVGHGSKLEVGITAPPEKDEKGGGAEAKQNHAAFLDFDKPHRFVDNFGSIFESSCLGALLNVTLRLLALVLFGCLLCFLYEPFIPLT